MSGGRLPEPRMREEFRRQLRARLILEAQTALAPQRRDNAWTSFFRSSFVRPALAAMVAIVVVLAGAGTAAAGSLPGDPGFGLKRAIEDLQVNLTLDDVQRVQMLAQLTDRRLAELQQVADSADRAPTASEEYAAAVAKFRAAVDALQQAAPQDKADKAQDVADAARDKHDAIIDDLEPRVPAEAKDALERAQEEEHRDKPSRNKGPRRSDDPERQADESRSPRPAETARPAETPRTTEHSDSSRSPRPTATATPRTTPRASDGVDGEHD